MANAQKQLVNLQAQQLALQAANAAADNEYRKKRYEELELPQFSWMKEADKERIALEARQTALQEQLMRINATGEFEGSPTWEKQLQQAGLLGTLNGQQTLAGQAQQAQLTGMVNGSPTWQALLDQAALTGQFNGQQTSAERTADLNRQLAQAAATGLFNGQETTAEKTAQLNRLLAQAEATGMFNGEMTTAEKTAMLSRAATEASMTGTYNGQQTTDWQAKQAELTGTFNGQNTLARDIAEQNTGVQMANLAASLQGPENAFKFLRVMNGTPQGLRDLSAAALGKFVMPGTGGGVWDTSQMGVQNSGNLLNQMQNPYGMATDTMSEGIQRPGGMNVGPMPISQNYVPGAEMLNSPEFLAQMEQRRAAKAAAIANGTFQNSYPEPMQVAQMEGMGGQAQLATNASQAAATALNGASPNGVSAMSYSSAGEQAPNNTFNYQPTGDGQYYVYPPGLDAPQDAEQYNSQTPMSYNDVNKFTKGLGPVNQINAENYGEMGGYQQKMLQGAYGELGITPDVFDDMLKKSLPRYGGPSQGTVQQ